jgi:ribulose-5-phosphate 4-epimerase/fuculose-1-phosphate aldolase
VSGQSGPGGPDLVQLARDLYLRALSPGTTGNVSQRVADHAMEISPTNSCLGYLAGAELSRVNLRDGRRLAGPAPSKESGLHRVLYADPAIAAVVHLHSPWATALSCLDADVRPDLERFTPYFTMKVAPLALVPYFPPGAAQGPDLLRSHLAGGAAALLRNHGTITGGSTLLEAANRAEEIEQAARTWFVTCGHQVRLLPTTPPTSVVGV